MGQELNYSTDHFGHRRRASIQPGSLSSDCQFTHRFGGGPLDGERIRLLVRQIFGTGPQLPIGVVLIAKQQKPE